MKNILFIDDDPSTLCLYELYLESLWYNVYSTTDTEQGMNVFIQLYFSIIVTDYNMPNENGIEFIQRIKKECKKLNRPYPYIIMASAEDSLSTKYNFQNTTHFDLFLKKPIGQLTLISALDTIAAIHEKKSPMPTFSLG